ncbi:PAAR-like protein [Costertonia aggregata]|uniref:DUF4280 domain-containing protein n=1 Tax=Costertonia aggregata TaxID=343403 RepID=A0A7H9ATM7_9FLAO|nr:polymorphic toxin-type HINT domain-containing protein [Costertonia aggregata]QLG46841.1 DUF4280 domain-containing protein [Costertonia aggregata]
MGAKKYVPQGTYLACDKGTAPMEFKITNNNNSFLFDEPIANTGDMVPMVNVQPFGTCSVTGSACVPAPVAWDGFEDGIFVGYFNPLLEDSVLPCSVGGKIEIFYSLEEAEAACAEEEGGFWSTLGKVALVVAAVALIVVTGGAAIAAIAAVGAASGALATGIAVTVAALEVAGCLLTVKALYDYSQDGDEEALFKEVALGFLFLGAGKAIEKGFRMWRAGRAADDVVEVVDDVIEAGDDVAKIADDVPYDQLGKTEPCFLAGTLVKTPNGTKEIEKLTAGDKVLSYNVKKNRVEEKNIVRTYNNWTDRYFNLKTENNSSIDATSKHLFWITDIKKWLPTKELAIGMPVLSSSGDIEKITSISTTTVVDLPTFNLEIEEYHNYFVGHLGILVHNQNKPSLFESTTKTPTEIYTVTDKASGKVVYVGQTTQGTSTRISQHAAEGGIKAEWDNPGKYDIDTPKSGNWTPYEAHAWEQHHIEKNGGKANLANKKNAITKAKYDKFGNLHNPC